MMERLLAEMKAEIRISQARTDTHQERTDTKLGACIDHGSLVRRIEGHRFGGELGGSRGCGGASESP
jgi:hypothetical protein